MDNSTQNSAYTDIEKLMAGQNSLLEQQQQAHTDMLDRQLQMQQDQVDRSKAEIDQNTAKTNSGLYAEWKKASNRYGANAENLYTQGLGNSGFAESTQTNLYNTYQKNITDTNNTAMKLKADFDFQMQQARQNRDVQQAQFALELYQQKMNLLTQEYDLKNQKEQQIYQRGIDERNYNYQVSRDAVADRQYQEQFDYQKSRDVISDNQWEKQYQQMLREAELEELWRNKNFDYQVGRDAVADQQYQQQFDYQKSRDAIADSQWQQQLAVSKAKASQGSSPLEINPDDDEPDDNQPLKEQELSENAKKVAELYKTQKALPIIGSKTNIDTFIEKALLNKTIDEKDAQLLLARYG